MYFFFSSEFTKIYSTHRNVLVFLTVEQQFYNSLNNNFYETKNKVTNPLQPTPLKIRR